VREALIASSRGRLLVVGSSAGTPGEEDAPAADGSDRPTFGDEVRSGPGRAVWRIAFLVVALIALYILWPGLLRTFSQAPRLLTINPAWFVVMVVAECASFACAWALIRIALGTREWFAIATAQLAGNAFSRIVPGGAAAGGALQYRMLTQCGFEPARVGTALTAASLISTATVFALPIFTVPTLLLGAPAPSGLAQAAWLGAGAFLVFVALGAVFLTQDRPLLALGRGLARLLAKMPGRRGRPVEGLPGRLVQQRNIIRRGLGEDWWRALLAAAGNWGLDYLALLAALTAVGATPRPSLVLLAYVASVVLGMIPITPGGLGFVEAGLSATLALAGVSASDAILATLAYRLVSYWLPILAGPVAYWLHTRRTHASGTAAPAQP
jgi:uncharacterized membrane protein YbhN (UPF0104 family)